MSTTNPIPSNHEQLQIDMEQLFPQGVPENVESLLSECKCAHNVYREMLTQVPPSTGQALNSLRDLQSTEIRLLIAACQNLQGDQ